jgi:hypothetical protein
VCSAFDATDAADTILRTGSNGFEGKGRGRRTSISFAIDAGRLMLDRYTGRTERKIIDISTNGTNNDGLPVAHSRISAFEAGYIINGIAVRLDEPGVTNDLPGYLADNVIAGAGSFVIAPDKPYQYASAIRRKLVLEISSRPEDGEENMRQASAFSQLVR